MKEGEECNRISDDAQDGRELVAMAHGDGEYSVILRTLPADTFLTLGMAPAETIDKGMGCVESTNLAGKVLLGCYPPTVESSVGLREDGLLKRVQKRVESSEKEQGAFSKGDIVRMECKSGRLRWYHGESKLLSLLLAEAEGVPHGWDFGVSGMGAQVEIIEIIQGMPPFTEVEQNVIETRQKVRAPLSNSPHLPAE